MSDQEQLETELKLRSKELLKVETHLKSYMATRFLESDFMQKISELEAKEDKLIAIVADLKKQLKLD